MEACIKERIYLDEAAADSGVVLRIEDRYFRPIDISYLNSTALTFVSLLESDQTGIPITNHPIIMHGDMLIEDFKKVSVTKAVSNLSETTPST